MSIVNRSLPQLEADRAEMHAGLAGTGDFRRADLPARSCGWRSSVMMRCPP